METMVSVLLCIFSALAGIFLGFCYKRLMDWFDKLGKEKSPLLGFYHEKSPERKIVTTRNGTIKAEGISTAKQEFFSRTEE